MYNILEARIEFKNNQMQRVTVLAEISEGDVRAMSATTKRLGGYCHIKPGEALSDKLLQQVAGYGVEIFGEWREKMG